MNLTLVFSRKYRWPEHYISVISEITNNKPIFSQCNIFYNYEYLFFQFAFWSLFNHRQRSQSNQEQSSLCCGSHCFNVLLCTHYEPLQCFSTYFCKLKEIGVLRPIFAGCRERKKTEDIVFFLCCSWPACYQIDFMKR